MYIYTYIYTCILLHVCYTYYIYNLIAQPLLYSRLFDNFHQAGDSLHPTAFH